MPIEPGDILDARYLIKHVIAEGGMGTVYAGVHTKLGRQVAVKVLKRKHLQNKEQVARFLQEAQSAAEIHHRNIVDVIDLGTTPDGAPYFVMELLMGESLRDRMRRVLPMQPREIGYIIKQTLAGLGAAHLRGVIHRDIKPSNIFIAREIDGREIVKILDFGVSKLQRGLEDADFRELTDDGTVLGTPIYMSPEQAAGKMELVDRRTDIYACGVILYKALTGVHPYKGRNYNEIMHSILTTTPPPPSSLNPQITREMEEVIKKAMARDLWERFQSTEEFSDSIGPFLGDVTQTGIVLPMLREVEQAETLPSFKPMAGASVASVMDGLSQATAPTTCQTVTPVSAPSLADKSVWEGYLERSRVSRRKTLFPWLLVVPFAIVFLIVGGILLIVVGKYYGAGKGVGGAGQGVSPIEMGRPFANSKAPFLAIAGMDREGTEQEKGETVSITLTNLPKGSLIFINGTPQEHNPASVRRSFEKVKVKVEAEGFQPFETEIVPSEDITLPVDMREKREVPRPLKKKGGKKKVDQLDLVTDFPE